MKLADNTDARPYVDLLLRKSQVVREGERALSIRAQEDRGRTWADENGYRVRKVWKENLSAWSDVHRPKYDAAMDAVLNGEVPALWCYALDRFSRKGAEAVVPILGKARVIFDYERLDSMEERDRKWIIDRAENAREYSQRLSHNVRGTKARQRREGRWLSAAPFGVVVDKESRKISPDTTPYMCLVQGKREVTPWEMIVRIFTEVAGGTSARALARTFNGEGLRTANGCQWRVTQIRKIVNHPVYEGWLTVVANKAGDAMAYLNEKGEQVRCVTADVLPRMISGKVAARARRILKGHQVPNSGRGVKDGRPVHPLAGRVRCAGCNSAMVADGNSYRCSMESNGARCIAPASVMRSSLERYVVQEWSTRLHVAHDDDPLLIAVGERWHALTRPEEGEEVKEARAELKAAQEGLDKFHADDRAGFYTGRSAKYRIPHKVEAEQRLDKAEERVNELTGGAVDVSFLIDGRAAEFWHKAEGQMRRDLLGLALDTVTVTKGPGPGKRFKGDERVTIEWAQPENAEPETDGYEQAA
ncbi:recombinase family protein [Streptomyces spectabilis]|uniref:recombinase family protein n=1 Tax=Streptomyces spectabilis TaxID=68270 RepID=UPI0033FACF6D